MIRRSLGSIKGAQRFALLTSLALVLSACSLLGDGKSTGDLPQTDYASVSAKELESGGSLVLGAEVFPGNLNPLHVDGIQADVARVLEPTMGSAVRVLADGQWEVNTDYAQSVEVVDKKPLVVEVTLEPKAVWQGGTPIRSQDMVSFVKAMKDNKFQSYPHPAVQDISKVEVKSDLVYRVHFKRVNADWPAVIYPTLPAAVTKKAATFNEAFVNSAVPSNGPFRVAEVSSKTSTLRLERNPRWWGKKPVLEEIVWRFAEPKILSEAFSLGELDVAPPEKMDDKSVPKGGKLRVSASKSWNQITLNGGRGALKEAKVRQAISLAIERGAFAEDLEDSLGYAGETLDTVVLLPGQVGHEELKLKRDVSEAKDLLEDAGWKFSKGKAKRNGKQLTLVLPIPKDHEQSSRRAKIITDQLSDIGIQVKTEKVDMADFYSVRVIPLDFDLVTFTRSGSAFNMTRSRMLFTPKDSSQNFTGSASKAIGKSFKAAVQELNAEKRAARIVDVEEVAHAQASILPLVVVPNAYVVRDGVANFGATQFEDIDWTKVGWSDKKREK